MGNWAHMKWSQVLLFCNESMTVSALGACMPPARGPSAGAICCPQPVLAATGPVRRATSMGRVTGVEAGQAGRGHGTSSALIALVPSVLLCSAAAAPPVAPSCACPPVAPV